MSEMREWLKSVWREYIKPALQAVLQAVVVTVATVYASNWAERRWSTA